MKILFITVLVLLASISTFVAYRSSNFSLQSKQILEQERFSRFTTEENLSKANSRVKELEDQVSKLEKKMASMQVVLDNTNAMNEDLKARLDKASLIKENMDKKIAELQQIFDPNTEAQPNLLTPPDVNAN